MMKNLKLVVAALLALPTVVACDQLTCSQQRIKAIESANKGVDAYKNGLYEAAERELKLAIQTDPTYVLAHYNLGKVYEKQRKWDRALEAFSNATDREPKNANYFYDLGLAALEARRLDQAEKAFKEATTLDPALFKAHWRLGSVYASMDRAKEADASLRKAIEANPRHDKAFVALGHLYLDHDATDAAKQVFAECVKANENSAECFNGHGLALKDLKQFEPAIGEFKKALELESSLTTALYNAGMTYADWYDQSHATEQKERAVEYLQKFVTSAGTKDNGGYVKAANDKLYALSGS